jgi:hypothetical protein
MTKSSLEYEVLSRELASSSRATFDVKLNSTSDDSRIFKHSGVCDTVAASLFVDSELRPTLEPNVAADRQLPDVSE